MQDGGSDALRTNAATAGENHVGALSKSIFDILFNINSQNMGLFISVFVILCYLISDLFIPIVLICLMYTIFNLTQCNPQSVFQAFTESVVNKISNARVSQKLANSDSIFKRRGSILDLTTKIEEKQIGRAHV